VYKGVIYMIKWNLDNFVSFLSIELFSQSSFSWLVGQGFSHLEKIVLINVEVGGVALGVLAVLGETLHLHEETASTAWEG